VTVRLRKTDRELLRNLAEPPQTEDVKSRHDALLALTDIAKELELPRVQTGTASIRLGIPKELKRVLEARSAETGLPQQFILVLAARRYRGVSDTEDPYADEEPDAPDAKEEPDAPND